MSTIILVLAEIFIVIGLSRLIGLAFRSIKQPQVIGEIVAGIMLGPSLFGLLAPSWASGIFPPETTPILGILSQIGLLFFMFLIGLELNPQYLKGNLKVGVLISHVSILVPFALGSILALFIYPHLSDSSVSFTAFAMFIGVSLSITAFPVLARIITENNLQNTQLGALALSCAAVDDVTAWCLLAMTIAITRSNNILGAIPTIFFALLYIVLMVTVGRFLLKKLGRLYEQKGRMSQSMLAIIYSLVIISGLITEIIGIHLIFGAFLIGVIMPKNGDMAKEIAEKTEDFVLVFMLPIFFAYSGLRTQIGLLNEPVLWYLCGLVLIVAIVGKFVGTYVAARAGGFGNRDSAALGCLMNTRGLTELIVLNIGLSLGVISPLLFTILVIMALVTTFMTSPLLEWIYPKNLIRLQKSIPSNQPSLEKQSNYRLLVPVANPTSQKALLEIASAIAGEDFPCAAIYPMSLISVDQHYDFGSTPVEIERLVHDRISELEGLVSELDPPAHDKFASPIVRVSNDVLKETTEISLVENIDLVIAGWHRPTFSNNRLGGRVGQILSQAPVDVAIYVNHQIGNNFERLFVPYSATVHDDLALEIALRLLVNKSDRHLKILRVSDDYREDQEFGHELGKLINSLPSQARSRIEIETVRSGDHEPIKMAIKFSASADLTIAGASGEWGIARQTLGRYTDELANSCQSPLLITRCSVKSRSHLSSALENSC